jgi:phage baseplate assembly protein gpV
MKKILTTVLAGALVMATAAGTFAATTAKHKTGDHKVSGTIQAYDATSHALTVKTAKGETSFTLAADAKVFTGAKSVTADELSAAQGRKATVAYSENAGQKTAKTVRIVPASTKPKK